MLREPEVLVTARAREVDELLARTRRTLVHLLDRAGDDIVHTRARVRTLSPAATLERGYAVVQLEDGTVVREPAQAPPGSGLRVRVAAGELAATVDRAS